ncbi:MAG: autotransporter outer membrane beta-barrel domain-containing protein [Gammaproteobacteria bacterium]
MTAADLVGEPGGAAGDDGIEGRLGAFLNGSYYWGDKDATSRENAFDFDNFGLVGGIDYRFTDNWVGGLAVNYSQTNADFETGPGGDSDTDTYGGSLFGTYYQGPFYVDAHANYSRNEFETTRRIIIPNNNPNVTLDLDRTASGETDGNQYTIGLGAGYNLERRGLTVTPYGRLEYIDLDIDGYTETGADGLNLRVSDQSVTSLQSAFGAQLAYALSIETGVLVPQVYAEWDHEFRNDSESISAVYVNDPFNLSNFVIPTEDPDEDFFTIGASLSATFRNGVQGFVNFETVEGLSGITNRGVIGGLRLEF